MPGIHIGTNQAFDGALRFFKKQVEKAGVISELKKRRHYEKPSIRLRKKSIAARKRAMKNMRRMGQI
ncbi:MAG: 30S ribosomal protein S21 [Pseudomonadota bacterium]|nr:30S ribosomal protein S21 [Pseudomonadota bacterium]